MRVMAKEFEVEAEGKRREKDSNSKVHKPDVLVNSFDFGGREWCEPEDVTSNVLLLHVTRRRSILVPEALATGSTPPSVLFKVTGDA